MNPAAPADRPGGWPRLDRHPSRGRSWPRSLTLLKVFLLASALILCVGAFALTTMLTGTVRSQALDDASVSLTQYVNGVLHDELVKDGHVTVERRRRDRRARPAQPAGHPQRQGLVAQRHARVDESSLRSESASAFRSTAISARRSRTAPAEAELESLESEGEDAAESRLGVDKVIEVYTPILGENGQPIGAYEIYADAERLQALVAERSRAPLADRARRLPASLRLARPPRARRLEPGCGARPQTLKRALDASCSTPTASSSESSLEAIEALNATVEAKDPYTAGHSVRVQRIALAIGLELDLDSAQHDRPRPRCALPRHRQARGAGRDPDEARQARPLPSTR